MDDEYSLRLGFSFQIHKLSKIWDLNQFGKSWISKSSAEKEWFVKSDDVEANKLSTHHADILKFGHNIGGLW